MSQVLIVTKDLESLVITFCNNKKHLIWLSRQNGIFWIICWFASHREAWPVTGRPGLLQGCRASRRDALPLTGRPGLSQGGQARLLTGGPGLLQRGWASYKEAGHLTGRQGLLQGGKASDREAGPLTGGPGHLDGVWAFDREAGSLTGWPGLLKGGRASHRETASYMEAGPLKGRPGLSQGGRASHSVYHNSPKILIKSIFFHEIWKYELHSKCNILDFATKQQKKITLSASQNPFGLGTLFPRSSTFR